MSSYQAQGKLIAILELIICSCLLVGLVAAGVMFSYKKEELSKDEAKLEKYPQLREFVESSSMDQALYFIMPGTYLVAELVLAAILFVGASENKTGLLKTWTTLTFIMCGIGLIFAGFGIVSSSNKLTPIVMTLFGYLFTGYSLWIGYSLSKETQVDVIS